MDSDHALAAGGASAVDSNGRRETRMPAGMRSVETIANAVGTVVVSANIPTTGIMRPAVPQENPIIRPVAVLVFWGRILCASTMLVVTARSNRKPAARKSGMFPTPGPKQKPM